MKLFLKVLIYFLFVFFIILMIDLTIPYLQFEDDVAFLRIKQWVIDNQIWKISFYIHVLSSCILLIAGGLQFSVTLYRKFPKIHRVAGMIYIVVLLVLSAPTGFVMAIYANGGAVAMTAFLTLSVLWIYFTWMAYITIKRKNYEQHAKWMIRSFALTLSAITLRLWKPSLALTLELGPMDLYRLVAWLGFVPNLIIAELIIYKGNAKRMLDSFVK